MPLDSWCWKNVKLGLRVTKFISSWGDMAKMGKNEVKQSWVKRWWRQWVWWFWVLIIAFEDQVPVPWLGQIAQHPSQHCEPADLLCFSSVQFSHSVESDSLWPHEPQHTRPPCPLPTPRAYSSSCPLSRWCHPTVSSSVVPFSSRPVFPSIRVFSNESALLIRWPKYWSFTFNSSPPNEHPVVISFRMDWLDLLAVQGTLQSLLQHHSSKASILRCSAFFIFQYSYPYMTTGKTIALTRRAFVGKVMSLLFNMLSKLVVTFLPRSEQASFNIMAAITICSDFGAQKNKVSHCFHCFPIYLPWNDGTECHDLSFLNVEL